MIERLRKYQGHAFAGAAVLAWAVAFKWGWGSSEWSGLWASAAPTRGNTVSIHERKVESAEERKKRLMKQNDELKATLSDLKKDVLGDRRATRGDDPFERDLRPVIPGDVAHYTQRDACFQMKLEFPDRFGDVDCMSSEYDDSDPWFRASRKY